MAKKHILVLVLICAAVCGAVLPRTYAADTQIDSSCIELKFGSEAVGNIFYDKYPSFQLGIRNPGSTTELINANIELTDNNRNVIWSKSLSYGVNAASKLVKGIDPECEVRNGLYVLNVTVSGNFTAINKNCCFSVSAEDPTVSDSIGVACHHGLYLDDVNKTQKGIANSGFGWIRDEIKWEFVERQKGVYSIPDYYMNYVNKITDNGGKILLILGFGNPLYENGNLPLGSEGISAYAGYCAYMASTLAGKIDTFEIWNEANLKAFSGYNLSGTQYAPLLKAAYNAIKAANPNAKVICGASTSLYDSSARRYLTDMLSSGAGDYMDALAIHPYANDANYADENAEYDLLTNVGYAETCLNAVNKTTMPVWITEFGSTTSNTAEFGMSEQAQAINLSRTKILAETDDRIGKLFFYNYRERGEDEGTENNYGIINYDYSAKPAYLSLSFLNKLIGNADFKEKNVYKNASAYSFENSASGKKIIALWDNSKTASNLRLAFAGSGSSDGTVSYSESVLTVNSGSGYKAELYDMYGNIISGDSYNLSEKPVFVVLTPSRYSVSFENGEAHVTGIGSTANCDISILAVKPGKGDEKILYLGQTTTDENSVYNFSFSMPTDEMYFICVYNGKYNEGGNGTVFGYGIEIDSYINSKLSASLENLKPDDTVKFIIHSKSRLNNMIFCGAVYNSAKLCTSVGFEKTYIDEEGNSTAELDLNVKKQYDLIKLMIWNEDLDPNTKPYSLWF